MKKDPTDTIQKLLVLYLLDEISSAGRATVEAWLQESEVNRAWYESLRKIWAETGRIDPAELRFDADAAWGRMLEKVELVEPVEMVEMVEPVEMVEVVEPVEMVEVPVGAPRLNFIRIITAIAAVLVLGVVSIVFTRMLKERNNTQFVTLASAETVVLDTLTDGSTVILNTHTELSVPKEFRGNTRSVKLKGEAFFQVKSDSLAPFVIDAGLGTIKVLGTSFHVKAIPGDDLQVYVENGRVEVRYVHPESGDTLSTVLKAGERAMIKAGMREIGKPADIGPDELFWANRKLIFQETKLSVVFNLLKKHYKADIGVEDETILDCLLSATFTDETIDQILEIVATTFDLELNYEQEKYVIKGKGCTDEVE